jgi:hypothetical protein
MPDFLAESEVFEEAAGIGLGGVIGAGAVGHRRRRRRLEGARDYRGMTIGGKRRRRCIAGHCRMHGR